MTAASTPAPIRGPYANTASRKAEIVAAAANIFAQQGYHGGSLRQIARDLDLSFTSVKHHFQSKENLLIAVLEANDSLEFDRLSHENADLGFVESAIALARRNLARPEAQRLLAVLAAEASSADHPAHTWFVERYERVRAAMARDIADHVAAGRLAPLADPDSAAAALIGFWDGLQLQWLIDPSMDMITPMRRGFEAILRSG